MFEADDYQALASELEGAQTVEGNLDTPSTAPTEPLPQEPDTDPTTPVEGEVEPVEGEPANAPIEDEDTQLKARAFAELRASNNRYSKVFKQLQNVMGVQSEDEVIERLLNAGIEEQAQRQNVDPELLKRMQTLEEQNLAMIRERKETAVVESFGLLQKEFNLTNKEAMDFARELDQKGVDLFNTNVDLITLYKGLRHDDIVKKQLESEKQKWIAEGAAASKAPGINPVTGKKNNQGKTEINTMGELEQLFNNLPK